MTHVFLSSSFFKIRSLALIPKDMYGNNVLLSSVEGWEKRWKRKEGDRRERGKSVGGKRV